MLYHRCGNSTFSSDLYDKGYHNIVNIDYSEVVIDKMRLLHINQRPNMKWIYMDMTKLTFDDYVVGETGCFDYFVYVMKKL